MTIYEKINYVEFPSKDIQKTRDFFTSVFAWKFSDYGPDYIAFANEGLNGGFYKSDKNCATENGSALIIFYSRDLAATQYKIEKASGVIVKPVFTFPGGRRFHFTDPNGNEYAVWSDADI